jgi:hypothetical protein
MVLNELWRSEQDQWSRTGFGDARYLQLHSSEADGSRIGLGRRVALSLRYSVR